MHRVVMTVAARDLLRQLTGRHGPLMLHQSGGCCDGSAPMCYPVGDFIVGERDVLLGVLELGDVPDGVPVFISGTQFEAWKHTQLVLDVVPGRGSGFSLEAPEGVRFLSRGRAFTVEELDTLAGQSVLDGASWKSGARPGPAEPGQIVIDVADACPVPGLES
ncbi:DUF779 domain-containing protein [Hoyosella sp. YIM 151337]|uniref:DUF779 domain-containing protein n=1 Tax=Hoyosella sp. YIM 151337 TaxID=2992742 RepID=UPI002236B700|nr:DUF779 domain-containing protein [Hoyosella sp. YIM 151337]MCW4353569.1 DUF779 domain-containing protein [Hoyosella sp. YIM 151337]